MYPGTETLRAIGEEEQVEEDVKMGRKKGVNKERR